MAGFHNTTTHRPRCFWRLALLASTLTLMVGAVLWRTLETNPIMDIQARVDGLKPVFTGSRWLLIGLVASFWPAVTNKLQQGGRIDAADKTRLLALRWRVLVWLVLLELMLGQNLLSRFLQALHGVEA